MTSGQMYYDGCRKDITKVVNVWRQTRVELGFAARKGMGMRGLERGFRLVCT